MAFAFNSAVAGTGTVSCTGSTTVTGTGTTFATLTGSAPALNSARVGGTITVAGNTRTIVAIASTTSLTVDSAFPAFTNSAFTVQTGVTQTGTDTMSTSLGVITGFNVTNRGDLMRTFDVRGNDLYINGTLIVDSTVAQLRNDGSCNNRIVITGSVNGGELRINGQKSVANNGGFPYAGFDWLGTNGLKIMALDSTNPLYPAKLTLIDACIRYGADWFTTYSGNYSRITTQGDECWILCAKGTGTSQARLRQDNTTASIDFQAKQTWVGVWLNFGVPQVSLKGYTPIYTDGPEINLASVPIATRVAIENYDTRYVTPAYYSGAQIVLLGGAWARLKNNLVGTNITWRSMSPSGRNVLEFSKQVKAITKDAVGNLLSDGYFYFTPVGSNVAGIRAKGLTSDITFDLSKKILQTVSGSAETEFVYAWDYANSSTNESTYEYFCSGTTKGAETHPAFVTRYGYDTQAITLSLSGNDTFEYTAVHTSLPTTDKVIANASAITGVSFNFGTKVIDITGLINPQLIYDAYQYQRNIEANLGAPDDCVVSGTRTTYTGWTINIKNTGTIESSSMFKELGAQQVNIETGGSITIPYRDIDGLRVTVTGLDPEGFGETWFLRHKLQSTSTWTNVSGTGNTALILLNEGAYDVQVRAQGYEWESELVLNTAISLSLNAGLRYHVSANNTPQFTMSFNSTLSNAFQFDAVLNKVSITNTTGAIIQPSFAELYRATQRIQHIPALVWTWTSPVTANATSQKILIPTGNPISMYLTDDSDASVKITCPVIHADSGESADDRVKGNTDGFSIILGSPATAESAGLQSAIVSDILAKLGGTGFVIDSHSLINIKTTLDTKANESTLKTTQALVASI